MRTNAATKKRKTAIVPAMVTNDASDDFPGVSDAVKKSAAAAKAPFFRTGAGNLFGLYLQGFSAVERQHHNCHCCRRFIEQYGDLVTIVDNGATRSVFWSELEAAPNVYRQSIALMRNAVEKAPVAGVFYSEEPTWGSGATADKKRGIEWTHFCLSSLERFKHPLKTASQEMAERVEEFGMVGRGLGEFSRDTVAKAKALLETEQLYRGEKTLGVATWLLTLHDATAKTKNQQHRRNLMWRAVATAPIGFAHVKSTMIGTLLEDIESGMDFEAVKRRFADKMHPLQYQRAQVMPSAANIAEAEKVIAKMRTAGALERRFAKLEDIQTIWKPAEAEIPAQSGGVFAHLKPSASQGAEDVGASATMTWDKFSRNVLPTAEKIEMNVPMHGNFVALITAANPDAPPILQWDNEQTRNPVSWYLYSGGSPAAGWNLIGVTWAVVTAVAYKPNMWNGNTLSHQGEGVILILKGARDTRHTASGGFFTETLKSEYHAIRRTLEAYMMSAPIAGRDEATACGYDLPKGATWNVTVRVTANGIRTRYLLDRWD